MKLILRKYSILLFILLILTSCSTKNEKNSNQHTNYKQNVLLKEQNHLLSGQTVNNNVNSKDLSMFHKYLNSSVIDIIFQFNNDFNKENIEDINENLSLDNENEDEIPTISKAYELPKGFVYIDDVIPNILIDAKYYTGDNFIGRKIDGYEANLAILSVQAIEALAKVQNDLNSKGLGLKIFDGYRPQVAVDHFAKWAVDYDDTLMKDEHYPRVKKSTLFKSGYIAHKSGHSRGSTVDLTIINLDTMEELDMGTSFDFFGVEAHFYYKGLTKLQKENRNLLKSSMEKYGFRYYKNEWWHYTLNNEPHKKKYFNFAVK